MNPDKAPEPDGYHAKFFQVYRNQIGPKISHLILGILNEELSLHELNKTFIAPIPKTKNPESMVEFRPISLCNVIYKIRSKMLVNRIKPILGNIVGEAQSAFVSNRLIIDNIIIASEMFHWLNSSRRSQEIGAFALKIDMSNDYDRIE